MTDGRPLRVLRVLSRPNLGGPTRQAIALWHAHQKAGLCTLLVTGRIGRGETALPPSAHGVPAIALDDALRRGPDAEGYVELPDLGRALRPLRDRRAAAGLRALMTAFRPDVVHTHTSKAGLLGRRAALAVGVPRIAHTFHGHVLRDYFGGLWSRLLARSERALAARTDLLFAVSASCADELAELGVAPRSRFRVVPPAVALAPALPRAAARQALGLPPEPWLVAAVGRLVPIKRLQDFVAMVAGSPHLRGVVHGDGPERAALLRQIAATAAGRIELRGGTPGLPTLLSAYDALVVPSIREGCPLVAVEAFAAGVPVVGYDVPGVRDVLSAWGQGLLVPVAAGPAGMLAAVQSLRDDPDLRNRCVEGARAGLGRFSPAMVAAALASAYTEPAVTMR